MKKTVPNVSVYEGRVCSGDQFISTNEQKEKIRRTSRLWIIT